MNEPMPRRTGLVPSTDPVQQLKDQMRFYEMVFEDEGATAESFPPALRDGAIRRMAAARNSIHLSLEEGRQKIWDNPPTGLIRRPKQFILTGDGVLSPPTLSAIQAEATRAHIIHGDESMFGSQNMQRRLAILVEEYGEATEEFETLLMSAFFSLQLGKAIGKVAHGLTYDAADAKTRLVIELIQVAAMAASWIEALEGEKPNER